MKEVIGKAKIRIHILNADVRDKKDIRVEKLVNKIEKSGFIKRFFKTLNRPIDWKPYEVD